MKKADDTAPHETMIVLDAGTGQNAINQVQIFNDAVPLTGITITKLDGTAKGGVVFNIANTADIPIRFIGVGESIDDLQAFKPKEFVSALFETDKWGCHLATRRCVTRFATKLLKPLATH